MKPATFSLIQPPNGAIKIFFSFFMDSETPAMVNILKFYIYIYKIILCKCIKKGNVINMKELPKQYFTHL